MIIDYIKYTCSECGFELELIDKDEFYISDECGWIIKDKEQLCFICAYKRYKNG
jgi:DNA-directed RNA polymerase subunit RPC12/RpoP